MPRELHEDAVAEPSFLDESLPDSTMTDESIHLVLSSDETYVRPLAVAARSALDCLGPTTGLVIHVLDVGIEHHTFERVLTSLRDPRVRVERHQIDASVLQDLPVVDHLSSAAYARLLLGELLPPNVNRTVYLDADTLVRHDLAELNRWPLRGVPVAAALDERARTAAAAFPDPAAVGLSAELPYFNSGVLVIDLDRWRAEKIGTRCLGLLRDPPAAMPYADQGALNVVLAGCWAELPAGWNQQGHAYRYLSSRHSPHDRAAYRRLLVDPQIVHFTTGKKPWVSRATHPWTGAWYRVLDRTAFAGWRPEPRSDPRLLLSRATRRLALRTHIGLTARPHVVRAASKLGLRR